MELSLILMRQIAVMILILLSGALFVRANILKDTDSKVISKVVLYGACPYNIIVSFQMECTGEKVIGFFIGIAGAAAAHLVFIIMAEVAEKLFDIDRVDKMSLIISNTGALMLPVIATTLGNEYAFYSCTFLAVHSVLIWTYVLIQMGQKEMVSFRKII